MKYIPVEVAIQMVMQVFSEYAERYPSEKSFTHQFKSAGEDVCQFIEDMGYGIDNGDCVDYNELGIALSQGDLPDDISKLVIEL